MLSAREKSNLELQALYSCFFYSPSWELERRKRSVIPLDSELIKAKEESESKKEIRKHRLQNVENKSDLFGYILPLVETYIKESERKRTKTQCEINKEKIKLIRNRRKVQNLKAELDCLITIRQTLFRRLKNFQIFRDYLNSVCVESSGKFQTIAHFLKRFNLILHTRHTYIELNQKILLEIENHRKNWEDIVQETSRQHLDEQNELIEMKKTLHQLQSENNSLEDKFAGMKNTLACRIEEPVKLNLAIYNLYVQTCEKLDRPLEINSSDFRKQLDFIQDAIKQVGEVRKDVYGVLSPNSY